MIAPICPGKYKNENIGCTYNAYNISYMYFATVKHWTGDRFISFVCFSLFLCVFCFVLDEEGNNKNAEEKKLRLFCF